MSYIGNEPVVSATRTITEVVATAGQTVFYPNGGYTVGFVDVLVNGSQLQTSDFTATNGTSITLNSPASTGDDIRLVAYGTFSTSNTYSQSQVDSKIGNSGAVSFRNKIINGDMKVNQRDSGTSTTPTVDGTYNLDRWQARLSQASKFSVQQNAGSVTPPAGFTNYLGITSASAYSVTSTDYFAVAQPVEGLNASDLAWGTANAKPVTISAWVYSSLMGTFGGSLINYSNNRSYPFTYSISSANTWTQVSITVPGDTTGTWQTGILTGIKVWFGLGAGTSQSASAGSWAAGNYASATGAVSVVGTSGATFYITGVQLEKGTVATPYEVLPYQVQLAQCQRYYQQLGGLTIYDIIRQGYSAGGATDSTTFSFPSMRTIPTATKVGTWAVSNCSQPGVVQPSTNTLAIQISVSTTAAFQWNTTGTSTYITLSAEL